VHARAFTGERVEFLPSGSTIKGVTFGGGPGWFQLMLGQGKRFGFPDLGVALVIRLKPGESPEGKTFKICSDERGPIVHVTKRWKDKGKEFGDSDMFFNGYAVHLEFGRKKANTLPGRLYLALPDPERSFVAGTFDAEVATPTTAGAPGQPRPQR